MSPRKRVKLEVRRKGALGLTAAEPTVDPESVLLDELEDDALALRDEARLLAERQVQRTFDTAGRASRKGRDVDPYARTRAVDAAWQRAKVKKRAAELLRRCQRLSTTPDEVIDLACYLLEGHEGPPKSKLNLHRAAALAAEAYASGNLMPSGEPNWSAIARRMKVTVQAVAAYRRQPQFDGLVKHEIAFLRRVRERKQRGAARRRPKGAPPSEGMLEVVRRAAHGRAGPDPAKRKPR